ncbi:amidohydrolase family protein [Streptococcus cuniculi]|uniref:Amidohydrolase n=1 Tax=Streptococcus cuniculi TaxID=1432788 RepID=A0A4Y9JC82_9STRE|nr:amidohydrolase family protein [Streptococcus cuniculi]MBF0777577.1 amidohydrolase [Streptococcus cuniculi]TFU98620.1 amidohydrolase [Streptococcus cuniculi]
MKVDVFAHVLLPRFYQKMLALDPQLPDKMPFLQNPVLLDMTMRAQHQTSSVKQIISYVNVNPEDYVAADEALELVQEANQELLETLQADPEQFAGGVAMLALNHVEGSLQILEEFVAPNKEIVGIQLFSRHLGQSLAAPEFAPIFEACARLHIPIWLHPVFDVRKPDNNIVFSWEYEQTQAMLDLVQANYFQQYPDLKVIVHHAGAMVPYFAERIRHILSKDMAQDFQKFYVDTALLGNPKALELAVDYFGIEHVLFGTDAPLGILPAGPTKEIIAAIEAMPLSTEEKQAIFADNWYRLSKQKGV